MGQVILKWNPKVFFEDYNLSEEDKIIIYNNVFTSYNWQLLDFGYYKSEQDFLNDVLKNVPEHLHEIVTYIVLHWDDKGRECVEGMEDLVKKLKEKGYGIYLLSNAGPRQPQYWSRMNVSQYFDGVVVSSLVCQYKPCTNIYETLLNRYNLKADECIFIDDLSLNCAGAFLTGLHPIVFRGCENLKQHLRKDFGIEV